jgi:hypothetical protein
MSDHPATETVLGAIVAALASASFWHWLHDGLALVSLVCGLVMGVHGVYYMVKGHWNARR